MALYVKIPKDIDNIKEKMILNLTKRQVIFFGIGLALGFLVYWLTYKTVGAETAAILLFVCASPFFFTGMYERNGFTLEKILYHIIRTNICPKIRPYKTENMYRQIADKIQLEKEVKMLETGCKQKE